MPIYLGTASSVEGDASSKHTYKVGPSKTIWYYSSLHLVIIDEYPKVHSNGPLAKLKVQDIKKEEVHFSKDARKTPNMVNYPFPRMT